MLRAAWDGVRKGDYTWYGGVLCAVGTLGSTTVVIVTYAITDGNVANRDMQHFFVADGEGEISYDAQLIMVGNVREAEDGTYMLLGTNYLWYVLRRAPRRAAGRLQWRHRRIILSRPTFRAQASRITPVSLRHMKRCRGGSHYRNPMAAPGHA